MEVVIVQKSIPQAIATALQRQIISGERQPGERLVERVIAEEFAVSAIPVREALQLLEQRGLVRRRAHRGCSVIDLSAEELERICELRDVLEPKVIAWAAERIDSNGERDVRNQLARLHEAGEAGHPAQFFYEDLELHKSIWRQAKNPPATAALEASIGSLFACGLRDFDGIVLLDEYRKHEQLVETILKHDGAAASQLLRQISNSFRKHVDPVKV